MRLMLKSEKDLDRWFKENGWEEKKTKFGLGWQKEKHRPFLKAFLFQSGHILDTEDEEDFEEREDEEGLKMYSYEEIEK